MSGLHDWFQTPPGQYVLEWERAQFDSALADVFGYHALQIGLADVDALAANRMPHRWLAMVAPPLPDAADTARAPAGARYACITDSTALPFAEASLDLVVLPHTLELSPDPHATLREVQRVLVHEGKVAIAGLNPASLWGLRQWRAHLTGGAGSGRLYLPEAGEFIGHWRLRDWLRLLEFELEAVGFGCHRPAVRSSRSPARFGWMDRLGERWWPIFGAAYFMLAVKRSQAPRLVGPAWKTTQVPVGAPASIANRACPAPTTTEKNLEPN